MYDPTEPQAPRATIARARADSAALFDVDYFMNACSPGAVAPYGRHEPWLSFFAAAALEIRRRYAPASVVDIGCGFGLLVEALMDIGVPAWGYDISPYALANARADMRDRLRLGSVLDPVPRPEGGKYGLAICIEVLEHLPPEQAAPAVANLCAAGETVLFSAAPDGFGEPIHFNPRPPRHWLQLFAAHGYRPARPSAKAGFIAPHAFLRR